MGYVTCSLNKISNCHDTNSSNNTHQQRRQHPVRRRTILFSLPRSFCFIFILLLSFYIKDCQCISFAFHPKLTLSKAKATSNDNKTLNAATIATSATPTSTTMGLKNKKISASSISSSNHDSTVLRELKEIIQKQTLEITELKKKIGREATNTISGAHGGGSDLSIDDKTSYLDKPVHELAQKRVLWLSIFLCSLSLTAVIMSGFEHTLSKQIELAYFVPLLAGHGGNTGGQTVGTILSALSSGSITKKDAPQVIAKEALTGLLIGIILGSFVGLISYYIMGISIQVSTVIFCTIPLVSTIASTLGSLIPFICIWAGLDPSVIAAPAMTSFVDVTGLMSYFLIANQIFHIFGIDL